MIASSDVPAPWILLDVVALLRRERRLQREMRQPDDRVHRRADLVAHVGEEHRLHLGRFLGFLFGFGQMHALLRRPAPRRA